MRYKLLEMVLHCKNTPIPGGNTLSKTHIFVRARSNSRLPPQIKKNLENYGQDLKPHQRIQVTLLQVTLIKGEARSSPHRENRQ